jgi:hypothetical protein
MAADALKIEYVDAHRLSPSSFNPNIVSEVDLEKLDNSVQRLGMFKPVVVRELKDGALEVLAGWHRVKLAQQREEQVPIVNLGIVSESKAREISLADNSRYGNDDPYLFMELLSSMEATNEELATFLPINDTDIAVFEVGELPELGNLNDTSGKRSRRKTKDDEYVPQTHQMMRFLVPIMDADIVINAINAAIMKLGLEDEPHTEAAGDALVHLISEMNKSKRAIK